MGRSWKVEPALTVTLAKNSRPACVRCLSTSHTATVFASREGSQGCLYSEGQNECHADGRPERASKWRRWVWLDSRGTTWENGLDGLELLPVLAGPL